MAVSSVVHGFGHLLSPYLVRNASMRACGRAGRSPTLEQCAPFVGELVDAFARAGGLVVPLDRTIPSSSSTRRNR